MKKNKLLTTLAIASVVFIAGCNCNDEERWSGWSGNDNDEHPGGPGSGNGQLAPGAVDLGTAGNFVILSKTGITDVPTSAITGNIGASPISGSAIGVPCTEVTGLIYQVDAGYTVGTCTNVVTDATRLTAAVSDMETAYTDAAGRATSLPLADYLNLGGGTIGASTAALAPGVYTWESTLDITGDITLNGGLNAVFIFQVNGTLDIASAAKIILTGGAQAKNIFWQVTDVVTLGTTSHFEGIILGQTLIAMQTGASINGRLLAQSAVTLDQNTVTQSLGGGTQPGGDGDHGNGDGCKDNDDNGNHNGWKDNDDNGNHNGWKDNDDNGNHNGWNDNGKNDNGKKDNGKKDNGKNDNGKKDKGRGR